ncbi:MAG: GNAT family N-acetyltransferase [Lachnospiraceae bacterium]|nr:GNAT family N-acetyltransferase [Lachnospiraceae bacterium]
MGTLDSRSMALGAALDGYAIGVMVFHAEQTTVCIDHIFVPDDYKKHGAGHAMLEKLCEKARMAGYGAIEIQADKDDSDSLIPFLLREGFSLAETGMSVSAPVDALITSDSFNRMVNSVDKNIAGPLSDFSGVKLNSLNNVRRY